MDGMRPTHTRYVAYMQQSAPGSSAVSSRAIQELAHTIIIAYRIICDNVPTDTPAHAGEAPPSIPTRDGKVLLQHVYLYAIHTYTNIYFYHLGAGT